MRPKKSFRRMKGKNGSNPIVKKRRISLIRKKRLEYAELISDV